MREPALVRLLPDGRRLHLHDGPIDLIVQAEGSWAVESAYRTAAARFVTILDELCAELPVLRAPARPDGMEPNGAIAQKMFAAVQPYCDHHFITPMAAVAGAVAEEVLSAMTQSAELDRAYVNNGGDIAVHLAPGCRYRIGMIERPEKLTLFGAVEISADSAVRGIATSGWRGRSFSLGIADAVTVLAASASDADAAATIIGNAVDLPGHLGIVRVPAREIAPDSDLGDLLVTRGVGMLASRDIDEALERGVRVGEELREQGRIHSAALCLQSHIRTVTSRDGLRRPFLESPFSQVAPTQRSLPHA